MESRQSQGSACQWRCGLIQATTGIRRDHRSTGSLRDRETPAPITLPAMIAAQSQVPARFAQVSAERCSARLARHRPDKCDGPRRRARILPGSNLGPVASPEDCGRRFSGDRQPLLANPAALPRISLPLISGECHVFMDTNFLQSPLDTPLDWCSFPYRSNGICTTSKARSK